MEVKERKGVFNNFIKTPSLNINDVPSKRLETLSEESSSSSSHSSSSGSRSSDSN